MYIKAQPGILKSARLGFYIMKLISNNKIELHVWEVAALRKKL